MEAVQGRRLGRGWWEEREERRDAIIYFLKKLFIVFLWISYRVSWSHSSSPSPDSILWPCNLTPKTKSNFKVKKKTNKNKQCGHCSVSQCTLQSTRHYLTHCNESRIWFKASSFCYTIDTGPSLDFLLDILLLSCMVEILMFWVCRSGPFTCSSSP